jgi:hypothetical protein
VLIAALLKSSQNIAEHITLAMKLKENGMTALDTNTASIRKTIANIAHSFLYTLVS